MRVLQTLAFPLGHVALNKANYSGRLFLCQLIELFNKKMPFGILERAMGLEPINLFLGKEAFYQLNYARKQNLLYVILKSCQPEGQLNSRMLISMH
jgi:hypothetical protein